MPFYDYKCDSCGQISEVRHGMNEQPKAIRCEGCGKGALHRVFQVVGWLGGSVVGEHSHSHSGGHSCGSCSSGSCGSCH